ncbi:hypothetical protein [Sorangium sp. So ce385]|uniref:hypothetical protein n=1 Tax=Sorangium sp. So ce385 TaxID=3133308 RepID=UPI003F5BB017
MHHINWKPPLSVPDQHIVARGILRRAENFLRALFEPTSNEQPLSLLDDLERYLHSLPQQGPYFASAVRKAVEPPYRMPIVRAYSIGADTNIRELHEEDARVDALEEEEWRAEWRERAAPAIPSYWDLIAEAISANQKGQH